MQLDAFVSFWIIKESSLTDHKHYFRTFRGTTKNLT